MQLLIIVYSVLYLFLARYNLKWAIFLLIFALPSYLVRFKILGIPFTLLEVMILVSFGVWFFQNIRQIIQNFKFRINSKTNIKNLKLIKYPFSVEIVLLLIVSYISIMAAGFSNEALGTWKAYFFEPLLFYVLVLNVFAVFTPSQGIVTGESFKKTKELNQKNCHVALTPHNDIVRYILLPLILSAFVVSVFAIYQKFTGQFITNEFWAAEATRRVTSFFEYPNAVGLYLGPVVLLMTGCLFSVIQSERMRINELREKSNELNKEDSLIQIRLTQNGKWIKVVIVITILLSLLSIYFAKSEGALVAVVAALFLFGLSVNKKVRYVFVLLAIISGIGIFFYQPIKEKVVQKITLSDLSGEIRKQQWRETWEMMTSSPSLFIFGTGLSNYQKKILPYHQEGIFFNKSNDSDFKRKIVIFDDKYRAEHWQPVEIYKYPHNILLNFWTELGITGMLLFVWIVLKFAYLAFKFSKKSYELRNISYGIMGSMLVIIIHGLVDVPYFKNDLAVLFWLLISLLAIFDLECKYNKETENNGV